MPRRTRPVTNSRTRAQLTAPEPIRKSYEAMAQDLVDRGLASPRILDRRQPTESRHEPTTTSRGPLHLMKHPVRA